jgi:hypothetical protein
VVFAKGVAERQIGPDAFVGLSGLFSAPRTVECGCPTQIARQHLGHVMHDRVDIRRRIDRLVARVSRRDDYGQLLTAGQ